MRLFLLLMLIVCFSSKVNAQKLYVTDTPVYMDVIKRYIYVVDISDSSVRISYGDYPQKQLKIFNFSKKGEMKFIYQDTLAMYVVVGNYAAATKLSHPLKKCQTMDIFGSADCEPNFYKPIRSGGWYYYDYKGNLLKKEIYINGKAKQFFK